MGKFTRIYLLAGVSLQLGCSDLQGLPQALFPSEVQQVISQDTAKLVITTIGGAPITDKDTYIAGHLSILPNGTASSNAVEADMKIKGRGNYTWTLPKKPYKIKFNSKTSVMGMPADKEWVILANYVDKTLIRTNVSFELSRRLGQAYTPRAEFVDVTLNGTALGNYLLSESIKIAPDRINITSMKKTDVSGEALTGGYLVEINGRLDEAVNWVSAHGVPYSVKEPEDMAAEQIAYLKDYMQTAEDVLYSSAFADPVEGYQKYIDVDSFIELYYVHEILKNKDAANFGSVYLYKDKNQKLKMGPAWDFDLMGGNSNENSVNTPDGWLLRTQSPWYLRLFQDPAFVAKARAKWNSSKATKIDTLTNYIDEMAFRMMLSQLTNFTVWNNLNESPFPGIITPAGTYQGEVDKLKAWLVARIAWMDQQINSP